VQTFVPYADATESAIVLDNKRLNKQLLEGRQIYKILASNQLKGAWVNHPAVKMWRSHDNALFDYLKAIKDECVNRGINTVKNWNALLEMHEWNWHRGSGTVYPAWWGDERIHQSHRNNLYVKDPIHYHMFVNDQKKSCCEKCNYFWPTHTIYYNLDFGGYINA
jgi:hypothetical protein